MKLFVFGCGYLGGAFARRLQSEGWEIAATARAPDKHAALAAAGLRPVDPADPAAVAAALEDVDAVLVTAAPDADGCPALPILVPALARARAFPGWIGYVSTTGVYGDRDGGWVFEGSELNAATVQAARRAAAERDWFEVGRGMGLTVCVFRLPAIYGPGRSPFDRLRAGTARRVRKSGQVFNRIHVADAVSGMAASLARPRPGAAYNLCDDEPAGADVYTAFAAGLLGLPPPPEADWRDDSIGEGMRRFYLDNKRVSNALAKAELGWRPRYADWRNGLRAVLAAETA
ncbi:MAG: NAD(P)H-binding protein [Caulobacteraceae bacterium]|nr:NAD(P)H-binding protein [Caulobacteraceae bacterium]